MYPSSPHFQRFTIPVTAQSLANPFDNVREEPEFVEWGYGGMGSVRASADVSSDRWKGLQRSERGGALFADSSLGSSATSTYSSVGGGRGSGAHAASRIARRNMAGNVSECGMGNVGAAGGIDEDDGSGMGWVRRRRAEREAKARVEQRDNGLESKAHEKRRSGDSMDAGMCASTASTTTSLTACSSTASTDLTTPTTSPLVSRSSSVTDMKLASSSSESRDLPAVAPCTVTREHPLESVAVPVHPAPAPKDEHKHHVLTAVRLSPNIPDSSHQHGKVAPSSPVDTGEPTTSTHSFGEERRGWHPDEEEEQDGVDDDDDDEHEAQVSHPSLLTTTYKHMFYRTSGERLPSEPALRKSVDMWAPRRGKRITRPHSRVCVWTEGGWGGCRMEIPESRSPGRLFDASFTPNLLFISVWTKANGLADVSFNDDHTAAALLYTPGCFQYEPENITCLVPSSTKRGICAHRTP